MRVVVQWPRLGPYHLARLAHAHGHLAARGAELVALETASEDEAYAWWGEAGATPYRRHVVFPGGSFNRITPAEMARGVTRALDALAPDAVAIHSYSFPDARASLRWCRRRRRAAVLMYDSKADDGPRVAWREGIKRQVVRQYDAALVAGTASRRYLATLGMTPAVTFDGYDVVDNGHFARGAAAARRDPAAVAALPGLADPTPFFVCVCRYLPLKNLDGLLRAYAAYRAASPAPWRLVVVGDGPERPALEAQVAAERIGGVTLTGYRQVEDLPAYYGLAGALVHPAHKDTWGLVVNEAMAAGLPVLVSTAAGCAADLVRDGRNGFTFAPADLRALTALLTRVATAPPPEHAAMGAASANLIAEWDLDRFSAGLWGAISAGRARATRGLTASAWAVLTGLRLLGRSSTSFHSIEA